MKKLETDKVNLQLNDEIIEQIKSQLKRFEVELPYRKLLDEQAAKEAELKALKKKNKKK